EFDRAAQGRHADRGAQRGFPGGHRQHMDDVAAVDLELGMGGVLDVQVEVAPGTALPGNADRLSSAHALGDAHFQGLAVDADAHAVAAVDGLQRNGELGAGVATRLRTARGSGATPPAPEKFLEEVAEAATGTAAGKDLVVVEATGGTLAESAMRRPHLVAGAVAALA